MKVDGACHCGRITYEAEVDPQKVGMCNCTDCQILSGAPYRVTVQAVGETFRVLTGQPKAYIKTAESGAKRKHGFCGDCGTPIYATSLDDKPATYGLRVGGLRQRAELPPQRQIWCKSALAWSRDVSGVPGHERQ
jgi:hypothetical protein